MGIPAHCFFERKEVLRELDHELDVPCVVHRGFLRFIAPTRSNVKLDCHDGRIVKYREVTNLAIEAAVNAPCGGHRTHLIESISRILDRPHDWMGAGRFACASESLNMISLKNDVCPNL